MGVSHTKKQQAFICYFQILQTHINTSQIRNHG